MNRMCEEYFLEFSDLHEMEKQQDLWPLMSKAFIPIFRAVDTSEWNWKMEKMETE